MSKLRTESEPKPKLKEGAEFGRCRVCHTPFEHLTADCEVCSKSRDRSAGPNGYSEDPEYLEFYCP